MTNVKATRSSGFLMSAAILLLLMKHDPSTSTSTLPSTKPVAIILFYFCQFYYHWLGFNFLAGDNVTLNRLSHSLVIIMMTAVDVRGRPEIRSNWIRISLFYFTHLSRGTPRVVANAATRLLRPKSHIFIVVFMYSTDEDTRYIYLIVVGTLHFIEPNVHDEVATHILLVSCLLWQIPP